MPIAGKRAYRLYLDEENAEYVKRFLECKRGGGGLSSLVDGMIGNLADTLRASGSGSSGAKMNVAKVARLFLEGIKRM